MPDRPVLDFITDRFMLALLVWREARAEPREGQIAVAFTVLNRCYRPSWWGHTILEVISKKWQYSSLTDPHDPQLTRWPVESDESWWASLAAACDVLDGKVSNPVPTADSYYATSMPAPPAWADPKRFVGQIGRHRFYNLDRDTEAVAVNSKPEETPCPQS